jgi:hypothetical protein
MSCANISKCPAVGICIVPEKQYRILTSPVTLSIESIIEVQGKPNLDDSWQFDYIVYGFEVLSLLRYDHLARHAQSNGHVWGRVLNENGIAYSGYYSK